MLLTWSLSVAFVILSGTCAWCEGNGRRRPGLDIGFLEHGGMWGDLILLPIANAAIVPHLSWGAWLIGPLLAGIAISGWLHACWHRGGGEGHWHEHMWPARPHGRWHRDLSWAGWMHVIYVAAEFGLLVAYALTPMPAWVVWLVTLILTLHVPIGLLAPAWVATRGRLVRNSLLVPALMVLWTVAILKLFAIGPA